MTFQLFVDTAEPRIKRDRIVCLVDGRHWEDTGQDAFIDGITQTGMLSPLPKTQEWETTTTGAYARLTKADYTFDTPPFQAEGTSPPYPPGVTASPDKWNTFEYFPGDIFLQGQGVNDRAITNQTFPKNRSFHLAWFAYNEGKTSEVQIEFGWLSEKSYIGIRAWTDGKCEIFKNGTQVGQGNIFERKVTSQTVYGKERSSQRTHHKARKGDSKSLAQQLVTLLIIPCRRRDLLFLSNQGGGFRFTFANLDPDNPDNEITPKDAKFFWRVPTGQATVQCAPLHFKTSGYLLSEARTLHEPPGGAAAPSEVANCFAYTDIPGYGTGTFTPSLVDADTLEPFVPNGTKDRVRVKVALTGDGTSSYWVYGAAGVFAAVTANTYSLQAFDIQAYVQQATLSVPDNPADVLFSVTCNNPDELSFLASGLDRIGNRPVECAFGGVSFLTGRSKTPSRRDGISDDVSHLMLEFRDRCKSLEQYRFSVATPYDGLEMAEAMKQIIELTGYSRDDMEIPDFGFRLPTIGQSSEGEFALYPEVDDKALDWFVRLWQTYARAWEWGWIPTGTGPVFKVRHLDDLNAQSPVYTLYPTIQEAVTIGGIPRDLAYQFVYRTSEPTDIECEANVIYVTGRDPRTAQIFRSQFIDTQSCDPTLPPDLRPDNWLGEPRPYGLGDPSITTLEEASWVSAVLQRRLTQKRRLQPFTSEFMISDDGSPVWRGDVVTLYGIGDVRITSLSAQMGQVNDNLLWRQTHYTSELVRYPTL